MRLPVAGAVRAAAFRGKCFSLASTCSIGLRSRLEGGRKNSLAPAARIARRIALPLWPWSMPTSVGASSASRAIRRYRAASSICAGMAAAGLHRWPHRPRPDRHGGPSGSRSASARPNSRCRCIGRGRRASFRGSSLLPYSDGHSKRSNQPVPALTVKPSG